MPTSENTCDGAPTWEDLPREVLLEHVVPHLSRKDYVSLLATSRDARRLTQGTDGVPLPPPPPKGFQSFLQNTCHGDIRGLFRSMRRFLREMLGESQLWRFSSMTRSEQSESGLYGLQLRSREGRLDSSYCYDRKNIHCSYQWRAQCCREPAAPRLALCFYTAVYPDDGGICFIPGTEVELCLATGEFVHYRHHIGVHDTLSWQQSHEVYEHLRTKLGPWVSFLRQRGWKMVRGMRATRNRIERRGVQPWIRDLRHRQSDWPAIDFAGYLPLSSPSMSIHWRAHEHNPLSTLEIHEPCLHTGGGYLRVRARPPPPPLPEGWSAWLEGTWFRPPQHGWNLDVDADGALSPHARLVVSSDLHSETSRDLLGLLYTLPLSTSSVWVRGTTEEWFPRLREHWKFWEKEKWVQWDRAESGTAATEAIPGFEREGDEEDEENGAELLGQLQIASHILTLRVEPKIDAG